MAFGYKNVLQRHIRNIHFTREGNENELTTEANVSAAFNNLPATRHHHHHHQDHLEDFIPELLPNLDSPNISPHSMGTDNHTRSLLFPFHHYQQSAEEKTANREATEESILSPTSSSLSIPSLPEAPHQEFLENITGFKYDLFAKETGRILSCPVDPIVCLQKFKREWDVYRHVCSRHPEFIEEK